MAKIVIFDQDNKQIGERELADTVFNTEVKEHLLHDMVRYQLAARRQGSAATKNRSAVAGGSKKPYRQKGTGNARQGTIRAPHYVGGGVAFGPSPRSFAFKLNRKVKKAALCCALSDRFQADKLTVVDGLAMDSVSTKAFDQLVKRFDLERTLIVIDQPDSNIELSARNLQNVKILRAEGVNVYDILKYPNLILTDAAVSAIEGALEK